MLGSKSVEKLMLSPRLDMSIHYQTLSARAVKLFALDQKYGLLNSSKYSAKCRAYITQSSNKSL